MEMVTAGDMESNQQPVQGNTRCHHKRSVEKPKPECVTYNRVQITMSTYKAGLGTSTGAVKQVSAASSLPSPPLASLLTIKVQLKQDRLSEPETLNNVSTQPPSTGGVGG